MMRIAQKLKLLLIVVLGLAACSAEKMPKPSIAIINAEIGGVGLFETGAKFTLRIDNPATVDFVSNGAAHEITVNGVEVGSALDNSRIVVPRLGSLKKEVVVHIQNVELLTRLRSMMERSKIDYTIDSRLYIDGGMFGKGEMLIHKADALSLENLGQAPKNRATGRRFDPDEFRLIDPEEPVPAGEDIGQPPTGQPPTEEQLGTPGF
jgi:LEA14-like dessication related protein